MGVYTDRLTQEVRLEYMRPGQVEAAIERSPYIYVPFGSVEWHGHHNALGLDAVKTHEQLVGLAVKVGGVVYPPVFFGSGGEHGDYPQTYMIEREPMIQIVTTLLKGFERNGYRKAVLLSGHYPNRAEFIEPAIAAYRESGGTMDVLALIEFEAPGASGDHAAKYETSSMMYLHPETVDTARLDPAGCDDIGGPEETINWMREECRDHPCYGLVGIDPRGHASAQVGRENTERLIDYLADWLGGGGGESAE